MKTRIIDILVNVKISPVSGHTNTQSYLDRLSCRGRLKMLTNIVKKLATPGIRKWMYNISGFNQYGLMRDDLLTETNPDVVEALRRLPEDIRDERNFRLVRAMQLDAVKKVLPREQWTKYEEDILYLSPIVEEVVKEREEKERWNLE